MGRGVTGGLVAGLAAAGALALLGASPAQAKAPALIHAHTVLSVQCVAGPSGTVRAAVRVRMVVVNDDGVTGRDWATRMELKARLIPKTAGFSFTRSFRTAKTTRLLQNRRYSVVLQVTTDNVSARRDWNLQLKLIWDRTAPVPNVTRTLRLGFDESCLSALPSGA